jgi:hypothetical protein
MLTKAVPKNQNYSQRTGTRLGDIVYVRYYDAVLFKDTLSSQIKPLLREAVGWLDFENTEYIRLVWERYAEPTINEESRIRQTGLAIRRSDIIEMRKVA